MRKRLVVFALLVAGALVASSAWAGVGVHFDRRYSDQPRGAYIPGSQDRDEPAPGPLVVGQDLMPNQGSVMVTAGGGKVLGSQRRAEDSIRKLIRRLD